MKKLTLTAFAILFTATLAFTTAASAATYYLHLAGNCSTDWDDTLGSWDDGTSINCSVNQENSISEAASQLTDNYLSTYCTEDNWCYIINYSAGDAVLGYALANSATDYNIIFVATAAGAGGGSDIAFSDWMASAFTCDMASQLDPSTIRNMYNHNDTQGNSVYRIGGFDGWWYTSALLPGEDDGVVAFHSAGACTNSGSYDSLCECSHWTNHTPAYTCAGYNRDHYEIKTYFIDLLNGFGSGDVSLPEEAEEEDNGGGGGCG